jgi:renalase
MPHALVVGAGMSGTSTARALLDAGWSVTVLDKGRRHGGRLATRSVEDAVFDTGALDFATSDGEVTQLVERWHGQGLVAPVDGWTAGGPTAAPPARWRGTPTMRSLPTALAEGLDVRLATTVTGLRAVADRSRSGWEVTVGEGSGRRQHSGDALVLTVPAPQALALLGTGDLEPHGTGRLVEPRTAALLGAVSYAPSLTVLAVPRRSRDATDEFHRGTERAPDTNALLAAAPQLAPDLARVHDGRASGASPVPAFTLQATAAFSGAHLDDDRHVAAAALADQASALLGVPLEVVHVHGWRYAQVTAGIGAAALRDDTSGSAVVLAGDAFGWDAAASGEGVERAIRSGSAAADLLTD